MPKLPDIESLSQQIANLHLQGELILDQPVGRHIRRVTLAHIVNAHSSGPNHHLVVGGRECKYVELVANISTITKMDSQTNFILDDGFTRLDAWIPKAKADESGQNEIISALEPFDYAHVEGKVSRPPRSLKPVFEIISLRHVQSPYDIFLHLLQVLAEIDDTIKKSAASAHDEIDLMLDSDFEGIKPPVGAGGALPPLTTDREPQRSPLEPRPPTRESKGKAREVITPPPLPYLPDHEIMPSISSAPSTPFRYQKYTNVRDSPTPLDSEAQPATPGGQLSKILKRRILKYFRSQPKAATSRTGLATQDILAYLIHQKEMPDLTTEQFQAAIERLVEEGYIRFTSDYFHYVLVT